MSSAAHQHEATRAFTDALAQAVHDRELEQTVGMRYYYDAACVLPLVLGLRFYSTTDQQRNPGTSRLLHALLSTGYLGHVFLLRPHAIEFYDYIHHYGSADSPEQRGYYQELVTAYFAQHGVQVNVARLLTTLREASDSERHARFTRELRELGPETFVALELARGDWRQRLLRLHNSVIRFVDPWQAIDHRKQFQETLDTPALTIFSGLLSARRRLATRNNFVDAVALTSLHRQIRELDPAKEQVRFHTPSSTLTDIFASHDGRRLLSYDADDDSTDDGGILRNAQYYIVRASFAALHFPRAASRHDGLPAVTLDELREVVHELRKALRESGRATEILDHLRIGGRTLGSVIEDLEHFSFVDAVLTRYAPPDAVGALADDLDEVFSTTRTPEVRESLRARIRQDADTLLASLGRELEPLRDLTILVQDVQAFLDNNPPETSSRRCEANRDLGIVQWGITVPPGEAEELRPIVEMLFGARTPADVLRACGSLEEAMRSIRTPTACAAIAALFWNMGLYSRVIGMVRRFEDGVDHVPLALLLLRFAGRIGKHSLGRGERDVQLDGFERLARRASDDERGLLLLGVAHCMALVASRTEERDPRLVARSMDLCVEAALLLPPWSLEWCFTVAQCAALGTMHGIAPSLTHRCVAALHQMRTTNAWHYRFAGALAAVYIQRARAKLVARKPKDADRAAARTMLSYASEILDTAGPTYGDTFIATCREKIQALQFSASRGAS